VKNEIGLAYEKVFTDNIPDMGITEDIFREILAYRLLVERIGESDNNNWWKSNVLTKFGRRSLKEVLPNSSTKARIKLALEVAKKVEKTGTAEKQTLTLFSMGSFFENLLNTEIEKNNLENDFSVLEELHLVGTEVGWNKGIVDVVIEPFSEKGNLLCLGEVTSKQLYDLEELSFLAKTLFYSYGNSTKNNLKIPYYVINYEE